ncbi:MAG TPA: family 10 glycosylhydrolase [Planctomycetota bacterium]|nr:family 10 glycosylhydrolase [Planctomycetota bacterium]
MKNPSRLLLYPIILGTHLASSLPASDSRAGKDRLPEDARPAPSRQPEGETRAIWITRWDFKTEADVRQAVEWCALLGLNRIFFQVRGRADAFYRSSLEPWGEEIGGADPGFDPLSTAIEEARKRRVELHAWVNVMPAWKGTRLPRSPEHILYQRPEWFLVDSRGKRHLTNPGDYTILNPCLPEVRAYIVEVLRDIATRYRVDGIQLDYMRFIGRDPERGVDYPYDPRTVALFAKRSGGSPAHLPEEWNRWRGLAVDTLVYRIAEAARSARPGIRISVASIEDPVRAQNGLFQDVSTWQSEGWIDDVYPMTYHADEAAFRRRAAQCIGLGAAGRVHPGIGLHLHRSGRETARQIETARALGAKGWCLFAFASLFPSPSHESSSTPEARRLRAELRSAVLELTAGPGTTDAKARAKPDMSATLSPNARTARKRSPQD